jgi:hypothetical protein
MVFSPVSGVRRAGDCLFATVALVRASLVAVFAVPVSGVHRFGGFVAAHRGGLRGTSMPHVALAAGYASTVVAGPVSYSLVGVAYIVTMVFEMRETRHVKPAHAGLAVCYVATVALYPLLNAAGIGLVGVAYAYAAWTEREELLG